MANKDYEIKGQSIYITYLNSTDTELKLLDIIKKINGYEINCLDDIKLIVDKSSVGDYVNVEVLRDDKLITVKTLVFDVNGVNKIGVGISVDYDIETEPNVNVTSSKNESGPSGGLMTSLEIYNKLVSEDITKGKKIIGTGTIDEEGNVGEIGGVKYKLIGAVKKHADVFLCPKENYDEAVELVKNKNYNIKVIGVSTFAEALEELKNI
jgi:PDZ domain-containing protein